MSTISQREARRFRKRVEKLARELAKDGWLPVKPVKPLCPRDPNALGTPVLVWPRHRPNVYGLDGFCYYGRRASAHPNFYLFGAVIHGITHWQPLPKGPK